MIKIIIIIIVFSKTLTLISWSEPLLDIPPIEERRISDSNLKNIGKVEIDDTMEIVLEKMGSMVQETISKEDRYCLEYLYLMDASYPYNISICFNENGQVIEVRSPTGYLSK